MEVSLISREITRNARAQINWMETEDQVGDPVAVSAVTARAAMFISANKRKWD